MKKIVLLFLSLIIQIIGSPINRDNSWDFRGLKNKKDVTLKLTRKGGVGIDKVGIVTDDGAKLTAMFNDWCLTFNPSICSSRTAFTNFKSKMQIVHSINNDPNITWWASGNAYSHLDYATFLKNYTGFIAQNVSAASLVASPYLCQWYDSNNFKETQNGLPPPNMIGSQTCQTCQSGCNNDAYCYFYNWNNGPKSAYGDLGACNNPSPPMPPNPPPHPPLPPTQNTINWVTRGKVTPIRNQGGCGSCWAFTAVAAIESWYLITVGANVNTLDLSEQELISCYPSNSGCSGGNTATGINWAAQNGLDKESLWPYTATNGVCNMSQIASPTSGKTVKLNQQINTYYGGQIATNSEAAIKQALIKAPVTIVFSVDSYFSSYAGGVFTSPSCTNNVNHAMLAVGWDYDFKTNSNYLLLKNQWGTSWGENGYARVKMIGDGPGMCGLYSDSHQVQGNFTSTKLSAPYN
jgi:hypothetical protein